MTLVTRLLQSEQKAVAYANAAGERLDALAAMLRGSADIAFAGTDCSARRLRHHLFRCVLHIQRWRHGVHSTDPICLLLTHVDEALGPSLVGLEYGSDWCRLDVRVLT